MMPFLLVRPLRTPASTLWPNCTIALMQSSGICGCIKTRLGSTSMEEEEGKLAVEKN